MEKNKKCRIKASKLNMLGDKMGQQVSWLLMGRHTEILKESFGDDLLGVAIFGSLARGTAKHPGSDIDILIVVKGIEKLSIGERIKLTMEAEKKLKKTVEYRKFNEVFGCSPKIQPVVLTPEELRRHPPILLDLTEDLVILHDKGIIREEIEKLKRRLKELGAKKIKTGDSWFWILKPDLRPGEEVEL